METNKANEIVNNMFGLGDEAIKIKAQEYVKQTVPAIIVACQVEAIISILVEKQIATREEISKLFNKSKAETAYELKKQIQEKIDNIDKTKLMWEYDAKLCEYISKGYEEAILNLGKAPLGK